MEYDEQIAISTEMGHIFDNRFIYLFSFFSFLFLTLDLPFPFYADDG